MPLPMNWHCTGINIDSHSRFCWQNQDHFDLQFSIGARAARRRAGARARVRARASGRSMNWPLFAYSTSYTLIISLNNKRTLRVFLFYFIGQNEN